MAEPKPDGGRFKPIKNEPGRVESIDKTRLKIDPSYQRGGKRTQRTIAASWCWIRCGMLIVADRDGEFYIIDGQQRHGAAMLLPGITELPCIVFNTTSAAEEARVFLDVNMIRTRVAPYEAFAARITKGEVIAIKLDRLVREYEFVVVPSGYQRKHGTVCAVAQLLKEMERDEHVLARCFALATRITDQGHIDQRLIGGLCYVERRFADSSRSLAKDPYTNALVSAGVVKIAQQIDIVAAALKGQREAAWGEGIIRTINERVQGRDRLKGLVVG